jgi:dephospho-CoA kinase
MTRQPLLIGLTGPIGCGKSTIARMLKELGGTVIDADVLARRATEPGRATLARIRERFGDGVFDSAGALDRAAMAAVVFEDARALRDLEEIVHPEVRVLLDEDLRQAAVNDAPYVVIEAIKLVEGGLAMRCDEVWLVECDPQIQLARLMARGDSDADATRRIEAQGVDLVARLDAMLSESAGTQDRPRVRRLSTNGTPDETAESVEDLLADALLNT